MNIFVEQFNYPTLQQTTAHFFQVCKMSGEEAVQSPGSDPDTLDLSGADLEKLSRATPELILNTTTLVLDNNKLQRLDNIHTYQCLEKVRDATKLSL